MPLSRRALHGVAWMLGQNLVARACATLSQLVLAALLRPADFGLIGLAYTVTNLAAPLMSVGIDDVALQRQRGLRLWIGPVFWISLGLSLLAAGVVVLAAPLAASLYGAPGMIELLAILALSMPIGALATVPTLLLRARLRFGTIAAYGAGETLAQAALTIGFAWSGYGVASFVLPAPILALAKAIIWWRLAQPIGRLAPQPRRWRHMLANTSSVFATRIVLALIGQADYMTLGLLATQDVVGSYYFGFRLAAQPLWILATNFTNVLLPVLVRVNHEKTRQAGAVLDASTLLAFCVMPLGLLEAAIAAPVMRACFGTKWLAAIPVIQLLSIALAFDAVSWVAGTLLSARGEFRLLLKYTIALLPLFVALVLAGALLGSAVGVAWAVLLYYVTSQPILVCLIYRRIGVSVPQVLAIYARPLACATLGIGGAALLGTLPVLADSPLFTALLIGVVGLGAYAGLVRLLAPSVWHQARARLAVALHRRVPA